MGLAKLPGGPNPPILGANWLRSAREELASFGARRLGFVRRSTQLANGFVRRGRDWLRSARESLASFGALPSLPMASWLMRRIGWKRHLCAPGGTDFSRSEVQEWQGIGPTEVGPTPTTIASSSPVPAHVPASFGAAETGFVRRGEAWLRSARGLRLRPWATGHRRSSSAQSGLPRNGRGLRSRLHHRGITRRCPAIPGTTATIPGHTPGEGRVIPGTGKAIRACFLRNENEDGARGQDGRRNPRNPRQFGVGRSP
jgi:hypothetical protein